MPVFYVSAIDFKKYRRATGKDGIEQIREGIREGGRAFAAAVKAEAPVRSGAGRDSIGFRTTQDGHTITLSIYGRDYLKYVIEGTKPHDIEPRSGRALHFEWNGHEVFFGRVHHPGTKPNNFPLRAWEKAAPLVLGAIARGIARAFGR